MTGLGKELIDRVVRAGDTSAGAFNLAAALIEIAASEADAWTRHPEDATRIPDMLSSAASDLRRKAKQQEERVRRELEKRLRCPNCNFCGLIASFDCLRADEDKAFCPNCREEFPLEGNIVASTNVPGG